MNTKPTDILLVEDNPDHVELILDSFENHDLKNKVHVVNDGENALDFIFQRREYENAPRPGLILLDIKLPQINGIEVLQRIKADENLKPIPVIMLTTSDNDIDVEQSYKNGANNYIVKPVNYKNFMNAITEMKLYWLVRSRIPK